MRVSFVRGVTRELYGAKVTRDTYLFVGGDLDDDFDRTASMADPLADVRMGRNLGQLLGREDAAVFHADDAVGDV